MKVYLSSKGVDERSRQHAETWRQHFLQSGIQGTSIVFGNGSVDEAMDSFPPSAQELQDTFVAVFTGPERPAARKAGGRWVGECADLAFPCGHRGRGAALDRVASHP